MVWDAVSLASRAPNTVQGRLPTDVKNIVIRLYEVCIGVVDLAASTRMLRKLFAIGAPNFRNQRRTLS